jgi:8-oxo-dGTP diphosphatase
VVAVIVREGKLLVIRRSQTVRAPGAFCFPGGAMELNESEEEALCREMLEEVGVVVRPVRRLHVSMTPWQVEVRWWLAEIAAQADFVLHPAEVESLHWQTPAELMAMDALLESNRDFLAAWQRQEFTVDGLEWPRPQQG